MKKRIHGIMHTFAIIGMIALSSCAAMSQKHKGGEVESYYEDLSSVRPSFQTQTTTATTAVAKPPEEIKVYRDASKAVNAKMDTLAFNKPKTAQGFRILIYAGSSSDESQRMKQQVYAYNSDLNVYSQYRPPSFRVKVGDFQDRVEASYILNDLKRNFPNAMIVPDEINLVR